MVVFNYSFFWILKHFIHNQPTKQNLDYNFLPLIHKILMQMKTISDYLNQQQKILKKLPINKNIHKEPSQILDNYELLPQLEKNFSSKITQVKETLNLKISEALYNDHKRSISAQQKNILLGILKNMNRLNQQSKNLLEQGLIIIYNDLGMLSKQLGCISGNNLLAVLVKTVMNSIKPLIIDYFVYQEITQRKQAQKYGNKTIYDQNLKLLAEDLEKDLRKKPFSQLLKKELKRQEEKLNSASQICRICFNKINISQAQQHVIFCRRENHLKQAIEQKHYQLLQLKLNIKEKSQSPSAFQECQQSYQEYKTIAKAIAIWKDKPIDRRCSLVQTRSQRVIEDRIEGLISNYMDEFGQEQYLRNFLVVSKEKINLEKKLNRVTTCSLHNKENYSKGGKNIQSPLKTQKVSLFVPELYQIQKNSSSCFSDIISANSLDKEESYEQLIKIDPLEKMMKSKSKFSRRLFEPQSVVIQSSMKYSSLHDIAERQQLEKVSLDHFQILKVLGEGAFGKVYLVKRRQTGDFYAMKILKIPENAGSFSFQSVKKQHQIFKKIAGEHLVKAPFSFDQKSSHIFILEYLPGGDLRKMLEQEVYFEDDKAKVLIAEIVLAIEHLHKSSIIHRDLKPQNLVFDKDGHLKLTDFGLSQFQMQEKLQKSRNQSASSVASRKNRRRRQAVLTSNKQKMNLIGTPDYIAPEIIFKTSLNNFSIDWWSLGVMAYQLMIGTRPFCAESIEEVIDNITNFNIEWPEQGFKEGMISPVAKDFISSLLNMDFMHRLGANGAEEIKRHPFFEGVDWQTIKSQKSVVKPKSTDLSQLALLKQNPLLKTQINCFLERDRKKKQINLERFVRFDILGSETLESIQKTNNTHQAKLDNLKKLQQVYLQRSVEQI